MLHRWQATLRASRKEVAILASSSDRGDILKARLPLPPCHPRALLTIFEGLSLWQGQPLTVAVVADESYPPWTDSRLFGDEMFPGESVLVRYTAVARGPQRRLVGLGDFRAVRRMVPEGER